LAQELSHKFNKLFAFLLFNTMSNFECCRPAVQKNDIVVASNDNVAADTMLKAVETVQESNALEMSAVQVNVTEKSEVSEGNQAAEASQVVEDSSEKLETTEEKTAEGTSEKLETTDEKVEEKVDEKLVMFPKMSKMFGKLYSMAAPKRKATKVEESTEKQEETTEIIEKPEVEATVVEKSDEPVESSEKPEVEPLEKEVESIEEKKDSEALQKMEKVENIEAVEVLDKTTEIVEPTKEEAKVVETLEEVKPQEVQGVAQVDTVKEKKLMFPRLNRSLNRVYHMFRPVAVENVAVEKLEEETKVVEGGVTPLVSVGIPVEESVKDEEKENNNLEEKENKVNCETKEPETIVA